MCVHLSAATAAADSEFQAKKQQQKFCSLATNVNTVNAVNMEGSLSKWTNVMKGWQYRWFVLDETAGLFSYYTSRDKMVRGVRRGCVRLRGAVIGIDDEDEATFTITVDGKTFHFQVRLLFIFLKC